MILERIEQFDKALFQQLFNWNQSQRLTPLSLLWSRSGDGWPYLVFAAYLWWHQGQAELQLLSLLLLGFVIERPVYYVCKNSFQRTRPCDCRGGYSVITPSDKFSLPSGHSAAAWLFATLVAQFYPQMALPLYVWASCVAVSRVLLGVHYPLDVLLGSLMGYSCALLVLMVTGTI